MCGIAGFVGNADRETLVRMIESVAHRGPDDRGFLLRGKAGLAHARLSIIDTSSAGHQPMEMEDNSVAVVLNGEIYNFKELRARLAQKGVRFRSASDTEVILHLYREKGVDCFADLAGMFAIGLYDFKKDMLVLARDRMGEKPLYWTQRGSTLFFGSEVRALIASGGIEREIDRGALAQYLAFDYVPTPLSIWKGVQKLEPGTYLTYTGGVITKHAFWAPPDTVSRMPERRAMQELGHRLESVVARELIADVPLGVFLSGGIDSSTVAYFAQKKSGSVETFSIGFDDPSFDESAYARTVARHLGTKHHEKRVSAEDALALVPALGDVLDEPLADASIIPTLLLSKFARERVTVALGGDGGDELFAGYPTFRAETLYRIPLLPDLARAAGNILPASHDNFPLSYSLRKFGSSSQQDPVHRHLEWLGTFGPVERTALIGEAGNVFAFADAHARAYQAPDEGNRLLWTYARTYLMDQVLVKVDRASMRFALETRAPFLDHTFVELAFSLPYAMKCRRGANKYILKKLMRGKLPDAIVDRKKKGFGVPLAKWLAGPLRGLCTDLLAADRLRAQGIFEPEIVSKLVEEHMQGRKDNRKELWNLMVFQLWFDRWMR